MKDKLKPNIFLPLLIFLIFQSCISSIPKVQLIYTAFDTHNPSFYGLDKLKACLDSFDVTVEQVSEFNNSKADYYIFAGLSSEENQATKMIKELQLPLPSGKEALLIQNTTFNNKPAIILCGADEVGLMYATLDLAKRISWSTKSQNLFEFVKNASESPDVKERCISAGTFQRRYFEQKLYDTLYWEKYFDMMAENRLNQFLLIFGYKNNQMREPNFMAPAYPNFFNVEEYPYVKMKNVTEAQQQKNTKALKKVIALAHSRGIEFGVGLWDQIERDGRYKAMVSSDGEIPADLPDNIIWGLTQENLIPYTKIAMRKFFQTFPEIDLVQFRMHWEAGITGDVALKFWKEIFNILKQENPKLKVEARAKDVPDETLYDGVETGMDFRVATKHWMEQMGMPFHPTHVNKDNQFDRRHGYADLLRYPKKYGFKWRVWSGGTTRLFLWGDPDWVKIFAEGSHLYDAVGFEFNEPLYFKMNGSKHATEVSNLLNPKNKYYTYEFERYWHYFQVMGRVAYNPDTPTDIWEVEFKNRFGDEAGMLLMDALHQASKVLPRIVSASYLYPRFASPQGWPELQRMESLKHFAANSKPSDIQQFANVREEADDIINGTNSVKRNPSQISEWFSNTSASILSKVRKAEAAVGENPSKEFISTVTDLKMLANLALYHSQRLLAAVQYNVYTKTGDLFSFDRALDYEAKAVDAYGSLVAAAGDVYNMQLDFGSNKDLFPGHWKNEHQRLVDELAELKKERKTLPESGVETPLKVKNNDDKDAPLMEVERITTAPLNKGLKVSAKVFDNSGIEFVNLRYRHVSQFEDYQSVEMKLNPSSNKYEATIPSEFFGGKYDVMYFVEAMDTNGNGRMYPDMEIETPYVIVHLIRD